MGRRGKKADPSLQIAGVCPECGIEFSVYRTRAKEMCSIACKRKYVSRDASLNRAIRDQARANAAVVRSQRQCESCGSECGRKYCNHVCRHAALKATHHSSGDSKTCQACGSLFVRMKGDKKWNERKLCRNTCRGAFDVAGVSISILDAAEISGLSVQGVRSRMAVQGSPHRWDGWPSVLRPRR
jgi:hypothetical protein